MAICITISFFRRFDSNSVIVSVYRWKFHTALSLENKRVFETIRTKFVVLFCQRNNGRSKDVEEKIEPQLAFSCTKEKFFLKLLTFEKKHYF